MAEDAESLEQEFKEILRSIRQYIPFVNSNANLMQCRLWLEKLNSFKVNKPLRNAYLKELCKQIEANKLLAPFDEAPPKGNLINLKDCPRSKAPQNTPTDKSRQFEHGIGTGSGEPIPQTHTSNTEDDGSWLDLTTTATNSDTECNTGTAKLSSNVSSHTKSNNCVSQDWKKAIKSLELRLSDMIQQNKELKNLIEKLRKNKQNDSLQDEKHIEELESLFKDNLQKQAKEHEDEIKRISSAYEQRIKQLNDENAKMITRKDEEIDRLSEIIQNQCLRIMNDISALKTQVASCTCDKKIHILKKCVSKMDKLFQKSELDYIRQIEHLKQELELKENALQVQIKVQKAELLTQTRVVQKEEFEEILNGLEVKYIKMLENQEAEIMEMLKRDNEKIRYLKDLLEKHDIYYNDNC